MKTYSIKIIGKSMLPVMLPGQSYIVRLVIPSEVKVKDIIVYDKGFAYPTAHRVIEIFHTTKNIIFQTKGDNNEMPDDYIVFDYELIGKLNV